eukprot:333959-Prymnesium_polylepis.2
MREILCAILWSPEVTCPSPAYSPPRYYRGSHHASSRGGRRDLEAAATFAASVPPPQPPGLPPIPPSPPPPAPVYQCAYHEVSAADGAVPTTEGLAAELLLGAAAGVCEAACRSAEATAECCVRCACSQCRA